MASPRFRANSDPNLLSSHKSPLDFEYDPRCRACGKTRNGGTFKMYCGDCIRAQWGERALVIPEEESEVSYRMNDPPPAFKRSKSHETQVE